MKWTKEKPEFKKECLLIVAHKWREHYEYTVYQVKKLESDEGWYWGWLTGDGDEYGDIADLRADLYCVITLIENLKYKL